MKRIKIVCVLVLVGVMCAGCNGITADASHAALLDNTAGWAQAVSLMADLPDVCKDQVGEPAPECDCIGGFNKHQIKGILTQNAELWRAFQLAKDGPTPLPPAPKIGE